MSALNAISPDKLLRLIGTGNCPAIVDVRDSASHLVPASRPAAADDLESWAGDLIGPAVVLCHYGQSRSAGVAAMLRARGVDAEILEGGFGAWQSARFPTVDASK